jgi:hypothetical protein
MNKEAPTKEGFATRYEYGYRDFKDKFLSDLNALLRNELIKFAQPYYADKETCIHNVDYYLKSQQ